jgi:DNA-binding transcriptional LysR family regulator
MRHRLDDIVAFLHVVETGSVSAAAQRLNLSKSVVSKRISDLETALGTQLFHRSTRRVAPTENALAFSERICAVMHDLDEATEQVAQDNGEVVGRVRIAAPIAFGTKVLGPILLPLMKRHPRLDVTVVLDDRIYEPHLTDEFDLAIRMGRPRNSSLVARKLGISRRVVCCSPDYARCAGLPPTVDEIANHACLGYANVPPALAWEFEPAAPRGKMRSVVVRSRLLANNPQILRDAAIAGLGLAVLPLFVAAKPLRDGCLIDALPSARLVPDTIYAIRPPSRHLPRKVRVVIDHLADALAGTPSWEEGRPGEGERIPSRSAAVPALTC